MKTLRSETLPGFALVEDMSLALVWSRGAEPKVGDRLLHEGRYWMFSSFLCSTGFHGSVVSVWKLELVSLVVQ